MEAIAFERMAANDARHWWFVSRRRVIAAIIDRLGPARRPLRILEVGCGTGSNIALLQRYGTVAALEPDNDARAFAIARTGVPISGGRLPHDADLGKETFDLIVLLDVLEHIPDDIGTLEALKGKLSAGGRIIVTVPAMPWLWSAHDTVHHHQRRYTENGLRDVLGASGLSIVHLSHFNTLLCPMIIAARWVGKLSGRDRADDAIPPGPLNAILQAIFSAERWWVAKVRVPFGVSLAAVAEVGAI